METETMKTFMERQIREIEMYREYLCRMFFREVDINEACVIWSQRIAIEYRKNHTVK